MLWLFVLKPLDEGLDSGALAFVAVLTKEMGGLVDGLENSFAQDDELAACELLFSQRGASKAMPMPSVAAAMASAARSKEGRVPPGSGSRLSANQSYQVIWLSDESIRVI